MTIKIEAATRLKLYSSGMPSATESKETMKTLKSLISKYRLPSGWTVTFTDDSAVLTLAKSPGTNARTIEIYDYFLVALDTKNTRGRQHNEQHPNDSIEEAWAYVKNYLDTYKKAFNK